MGIISRKSDIEHVDTNILVRLITKDDPRQVKRAKKLFGQKEKLYVFEDAAMMEVIFVLTGKIYQFTRKQVADNIKSLIRLENLVCNKSVIEGALDLYVSHPKLSFVDCYLATITDTSQEKPLWTFDRKLISQFPIAREP